MAPEEARACDTYHINANNALNRINLHDKNKMAECFFRDLGILSTIIEPSQYLIFICLQPKDVADVALYCKVKNISSAVERFSGEVEESDVAKSNLADMSTLKRLVQDELSRNWQRVLTLPSA